MAAAGGRPASHFSTTRVADEMAHASSRPMWIQRQGVSPRDSVSPARAGSGRGPPGREGLNRFAPPLPTTWSLRPGKTCCARAVR